MLLIHCDRITHSAFQLRKLTPDGWVFYASSCDSIEMCVDWTV